MFKITRLADYGIMLMARFAKSSPSRSARDLAAESRVPQPTVSKVLKALAKHGLLEAHRGVNGGFRLARRPDQVSIAEIIEALEGPIAFTECCGGPCQLESHCVVGGNWRKINGAIARALRTVTLADMIDSARPAAFRITV